MSRYKTPAVNAFNRPARQVVPSRPAATEARQHNGRLRVDYFHDESLGEKARRLRTTKTDVRMALRLWRTRQ